MGSKKILDLGCGRSKHKGAIGFDCVPLNGVDVVGDLLKPLPFSNDEFDVVYLSSVLEHFTDITGIIQEVHRVLKPGGRVHILVPYYNSPIAWIDPTHKRAFDIRSFDYFTGNYVDYYINCRFRMIRVDLIATRLGKLIPKRYLSKFSQIFGNLVNALNFIMEAVK